MSKRTLILIAFLLVLTGFFVFLAISQVPKPSPEKTTRPTPTPIPAYTTLMLSPATLSLSSASGSLAVVIDTGKGTKVNAVTAVQLELQYDPKMITNVVVTPATFFSSSTPLVNTTDKTTGRITYALAIPPSGKGKTGQGTLATIQFQSLLTKGGSTQITILPTTLVTAQGVAQSVFQKGKGATIITTGPSAITPKITQPVSSASAQ